MKPYGVPRNSDVESREEIKCAKSVDAKTLGEEQVHEI